MFSVIISNMISLDFLIILNCVPSEGDLFIFVMLFFGLPIIVITGIVYILIKGFRNRMSKNNPKTQQAEINIPQPDPVFNGWLSMGKVEGFKNRYADASTDELIGLLNDRRYTAEAKEAAADIIAKRQSGETTSI